ncbi:MAG: metallophosphoesterase [Ignavibacteriae bacterium]|nr:metallophosphoesterase [Ignavibacteriota bacterium]
MKEWMFVLFRLIVYASMIGIQYYFYRRAKNLLPEFAKPLQKNLLNTLFPLFNVPLIVLVFWRPDFDELPQWLILTGVYPFYIWHFSFFLMFLLVLIGQLIRLPFLSLKWISLRINKSQRLTNFDKSDSAAKLNRQRRIFLRKSATILAGAVFTGTAYNAYRRQDCEITEVTIPVKNLPTEFEGFFIALISDIHSSVFMTKDDMSRYAEAVNSLKADLIAVPGDFVNSSVDEVYPFAEAFSVLKAPYGVYGVLGNHDYYTRKVDIVAKYVDECGILLLRNDRVEIQKENQMLDLVGVDDVGSNRRAEQLFDTSLAGTDHKTPKILLCHRPYFFEQAAKRNIALTLSGHTHGGQIVFAHVGNDIIAPARVISPYVAGLYSLGDSHMYVSRGIGTVGVPIRINCPPEITKITLIKAPSI